MLISFAAQEDQIDMEGSHVKHLAFFMTVDPSLTSLDVYQMPGRCFVGRNHMIGTLVTGSKVFSTSLSRVLTGKDCLMVHGVPESMLESSVLQAACLSDQQLKFLAGNSFVGHCFACVFLSLLVHYPRDLTKKSKSRQLMSRQVVHTISNMLGV